MLVRKASIFILNDIVENLGQIQSLGSLPDVNQSLKAYILETKRKLRQLCGLEIFQSPQQPLKTNKSSLLLS